MSVLGGQINDYLQKSSWIRKMFEAGIEMKQKYGADKVYDFSLGNPDLPPPASVEEGLMSIAKKAKDAYAFGYMPNGGYPHIRKKLAGYLSQEQGVDIQGEDLIITCGAAGGLNALFRAVLEYDEEVICPAPYFVEYFFYVNNHGGKLKPIAVKRADFHLDLEAMAQAITPKTRAVLINSPNNPTGQVYSQEELQALADILKDKSKQQNRPIFLISDEPYRFLTFDGCEVPSLLPFYDYSIVVSSFSKNLSLAGERIGYVLLNPRMPEKQVLMDGLTMTNRILGFVNAPAIGQQLLEFALGSNVDISIFERRRSLMKQVLEDAGYYYTAPRGGFYFFPQAPGGDDLEFTRILQEERVLAVPSTGFGMPGFFRMSFCVQEDVIVNSAESLLRAREKTK